MGELFDCWRRKKERGGGRGKIWRRKLSSLPLNQMTGENDFSQIWISNCYLRLLLITFHIASGCELNSDESPCMMMMLLIIMTMNMMTLLLVQMIGWIVQIMLTMMTSSIFPAKGPLGVVRFENANENRLEFSNKEAVWSVGILNGDRGRQKLLSIHF